MHASSHPRTMLSGQPSLTTAALALGVLYAVSPLVTPLYPLYQCAFGTPETRCRWWASHC